MMEILFYYRLTTTLIVLELCIAPAVSININYFNYYMYYCLDELSITFYVRGPPNKQSFKSY